MEAPFGDKETPDASRGTRLHEYFHSGKLLKELDGADRELMEQAHAQSSEFLSEFMQARGIPDDEPFTLEREIDLDGDVPGHPDAVFSWRNGEEIVILDLKTGPVPQPDASENRQLAVYAALIWNRLHFKACGVAIIQPGAMGKRITKAIYDRLAMPGVIDAIRAIKAATELPDAPLKAGEFQCQYCKAKAVCPSFAAKFAAIQEMKPLAVETLPNDELIDRFEILKLVRKLEDDYTDEMLRRIQEDRLPGWALKNNGETRLVTDPIGLYRSMKERYAGNEMFTPGKYDACRDVQWSRLAKLIAECERCSEAKAKYLLAELVHPFVETKPKRPSPKKAQ